MVCGVNKVRRADTEQIFSSFSIEFVKLSPSATIVTSTQTALASEAGRQRSRLAFAKRQASRALLKSAEAQVTTDAAAALSGRAQRLGDTGVASVAATLASLEVRVAALERAHANSNLPAGRRLSKIQHAWV